MRALRIALPSLSSLAVLSWTVVAAADEAEKLELETEEYVGDVTDDEVIPIEEDDNRPPGVTGGITLGATLNLSDNRSVVGQVDGSTFSFGFKMDTGVDVNDGAHEWRNSLLLQQSVTRTPVVDTFVKSADVVDMETIYLYHVAKSWGPFARFGILTSAYRNQDVRPEATTYEIARLDGTTTTVVADRLPLTDPFQPFRFKESLGLFYRPLSMSAANLELRGGVGARETLAEAQLAIDDNEDTADIVEVKELDDSFLVGGEAAIDFWGDLSDNKVAYRVGAEFLIPFATSSLPAGDDRDLIELTNIEVDAGLSFKLVEWASLDYEFRAVREPLLIENFQFQNNILLSIGVAYGNAEEEKN